MRRTLLSLPLAVLAAGAAHAQDAAPLIHLRVLATNDAPIAGAEVRLVGTRVQARTDAEGRVTLPAPAPGPYLLELRASERPTLRRGISVPEDRDTITATVHWDTPAWHRFGDTRRLAERLADGQSRLIASAEDVADYRAFGDVAAALAAKVEPATCVFLGIDGRIQLDGGRVPNLPGPTYYEPSSHQFSKETPPLTLVLEDGLRGPVDVQPSGDWLMRTYTLRPSGTGTAGRRGVAREKRFEEMSAVHIAAVEHLSPAEARRRVKRLPKGCAALMAWTRV